MKCHPQVSLQVEVKVQLEKSDKSIIEAIRIPIFFHSVLMVTGLPTPSGKEKVSSQRDKIGSENGVIFNVSLLAFFPNSASGC